MGVSQNHKLSGLKQYKFILTFLGGQKSKIKVLAGFGSLHQLCRRVSSLPHSAVVSNSSALWLVETAL